MGDSAIRIEETDRDLPQRIKNGFMRYRDFEPMTQGGEALLRTCLDENLGRRVVMKTLLPQYQNLETYQKRFLREARVTARISHPATVPVYELSRDADGNAFFTMKRLDGRDLCDILDSLAAGDAETVRKYSSTDLINVLIHAGQCLAFAHSQGVVHRDLKPANIMVGEFGEITVLDWGLAKVWGLEDDAEVEELKKSGDPVHPGRLTGPGDVQGTPFYMSPEQARETGDVDERTDIYNMGIILFEVLTGESYMSGRNFREIKRKILEDPVQEPRKVTPTRRVTPQMNAVCVKALQKDPTARYTTMNEFVEDLRRALLGEDVSVYREPALVRVLKARRNAVFTSSSAIWMVVGAVVATLIQLAVR